MDEYWAKRQEAKLIGSELVGKQAILKLNASYKQALSNINSSINKIYLKYADETGLSVDELAMALNSVEQREFVTSMQRVLADTGVDVSGIFNERYLTRLSRLDALKKQIYFEVLKLRELEKDISTLTYNDIINQSYTSTRNDLRELGGIQGSFSKLDKRVISEMLRANWMGGNYSSRIYKNSEKFASRLQTELSGALTSGSGLAKVQRTIRDEFQIGQYNSIRLIRTETNYFHNQAELTAYKDDNIEKYEYLAEMDGKTSKVCRNLNGEKILVKDAKAGENYPPMHPNCRSTTIPVVELDLNDNEAYHRRDLNNNETLDDALQIYLKSQKG